MKNHAPDPVLEIEVIMPPERTPEERSNRFWEGLEKITADMPETTPSVDDKPY